MSTLVVLPSSTNVITQSTNFHQVLWNSNSKGKNEWPLTHDEQEHEAVAEGVVTPEYQASFRDENLENVVVHVDLPVGTFSATQLSGFPKSSQCVNHTRGRQRTFQHALERYGGVYRFQTSIPAIHMYKTDIYQ